MIKKIVITNPKGEALELELDNPDKSGMAVINIEGLGPPKANINGQEMASADGMFYSSARAETRDVIFTLALWSRNRDSKYGPLSIEESRHLTYRYFPLKKQITITAYTDSQVLYTKGYVESNEPSIFSKQEQVVISVICPDPFMYEIGDSSTVFSGTQSNFEFPFTDDAVIQTDVQLQSPYFLETYGVTLADGESRDVVFTIPATSFMVANVTNKTTTQYVLDQISYSFGTYGYTVTINTLTGALKFTRVAGIVNVRISIDGTEIRYKDPGVKTVIVRENYLLNSDFRHPINSQEFSEYKHDGNTQYLINDWEFQSPDAQLDMNLSVEENCIMISTSAENFADSSTWSRRIQQELQSKRYPSLNIGNGLKMTFSIVYEANNSTEVTFEWVGHMQPNSKQRTYTLQPTNTPTLYTATFDDYPDAYIKGICVGRFPDAPDNSTQTLKLYAMKLEVGEDQTLVAPAEEMTPEGPFRYLADERNDKELIEFGKIWLDTTAVLDYEGTVDTGILITIHAFGDCENIHLYNVDTQEEIYIDTSKINTITGKPFQDKDDIIISTVRGNRYCRLLRGGEYTNIIGALGKYTDWFQISNGNNAFGFSAESGAGNISVTFSYQNAYVGV